MMDDTFTIIGLRPLEMGQIGWRAPWVEHVVEWGKKVDVKMVRFQYVNLLEKVVGNGAMHEWLLLMIARNWSSLARGTIDELLTSIVLPGCPGTERPSFKRLTKICGHCGKEGMNPNWRSLLADIRLYYRMIDGFLARKGYPTHENATKACTKADKKAEASEPSDYSYDSSGSSESYSDVEACATASAKDTRKPETHDNIAPRLKRSNVGGEGLFYLFGVYMHVSYRLMQIWLVRILCVECFIC